MQRKINWFGIAGGAGTIALIVVSLFVPWWIFKIGSGLTAGTGLIEANISPLNANFTGIGTDSFTVPLIWALNLTTLLTLTFGGIIMLIYSFMPMKPYSKRLLDFSYKKPLYAVAFFVTSLVIITFLTKGLLGFNIPIVGSANVQLPQAMTSGVSISVLVSADLLWPFWLSLAVAGLCIAARLYHRRIAPSQKPVSAQPTQLSK
ncbi:MAG TPA: hypothetical protein VJ066_04680 [Candidatus Bathyarchaeia archaeon]|nr:hypothetical protein [Candidatus Bathyarchaeia archaeon]